MNKNCMNLGEYNSRHVVKHVTLKYLYNTGYNTNCNLYTEKNCQKL